MFDALLQNHKLPPLTSTRITTLQVNVGKLCNQACRHCHVDAGPHRKELMTRETAEIVVSAIRRHPQLAIVDITGGAPELNPNFRFIVEESRALARHVIDRCNLTVLFEPRQEDLAEFLARHQVEIIASLPCYLEENVDKQRGSGVYQKSIDALRLLNSLGYGKDGSPLALNLIFNPLGPSLPPPQEALEAGYKRELKARFGVEFHHLYTLTNMPIARFRQDLEHRGALDPYMQKLANSFNPSAAESVMCRTLVSVGWDGHLYDCDFNQMLDMPLLEQDRAIHIRDFDLKTLERRTIRTAPHCLGCTAGAGSSCGGSLLTKVESRKVESQK